MNTRQVQGEEYANGDGHTKYSMGSYVKEDNLARIGHVAAVTVDVCMSNDQMGDESSWTLLDLHLVPVLLAYNHI